MSNRVIFERIEVTKKKTGETSQQARVYMDGVDTTVVLPDKDITDLELLGIAVEEYNETGYENLEEILKWGGVKGVEIDDTYYPPEQIKDILDKME